MRLQSVCERSVGPEETRLADLPPLDAMPVPHRRVEATVLRGLLSAIRRGRAVELQYQSMNTSRPEPAWRWITPHAFSNDGLRWHVRAYCHIDNKFKDFILSRTFDLRNEGAPGAPPTDDTV